MAPPKRAFSEVLDGQEDVTDIERPATKRRLEPSTPSTLSLTAPDAHRHRAAPPFQQPYQLLAFSYTSVPVPSDTDSDTSVRARTLQWNNASLRYFVPPPRSAHLGYGYERWIKRPEERGRLDGLLEACLRQECEGERARAGVVTWRGVVTKILAAPYEDREGWDLNVMCVGGTLYLEEHLSAEKLREKSNLTDHHRLLSYYGYAFESYCTSDSPPSDASAAAARPSTGWGGDVDTNVQWCSVVKTKLGSVRMILGGEVDCVRDQYTGQPDTFVELKTSLAIRSGNQRDEAKFEKKLLKFYIQSFLLGVPEIVVGFRTPSGYLQTLQSFKTMDLPRRVRGKPGVWDPAVCLHWGTRVFEFLGEQVVSLGDPRAVWRVAFTPGEGLAVRRLHEEGIADVSAGEDRVGFLPRSYWERVQGTAEGTGAVAEKIEAAAGVEGRAGESSSGPARPGARVQGWQV